MISGLNLLPEVAKVPVFPQEQQGAVRNAEQVKDMACF